MTGRQRTARPSMPLHRRSVLLHRRSVLLHRRPVLLHRRSLLQWAGILILSWLSVASAATVDEPRGMDLVAENEYLRLFIHPGTTEFAVQDKATQILWYSNPPDRNADRLASAGERQRMAAQLSVQYFLPGDTSRTRNTFVDSVELGQFEIQPIPGGARVVYTLGKPYHDNIYVPAMISKERLESVVLPNLNPRDRDFITDTMTLVWLQKTDAVEPSTHPEIDSVELFGEYRLVSNKDEEALARIRDLEAQIEAAGDDAARVADLRRRIDIIKVDMTRDRRAVFTTVINTVLNSHDDLKELKDLRPEHFTHLIDRPTYIPHGIATFRFNRLLDLFKSAGYDIDEINTDRELNNLGPIKPEIEVITIPIEYVLDGPHLVVRLPVGEIKYPYQLIVEEDEPPVTYPLHRISLLPFFGASSSERGYLFVPDGSGALIRFTGEKESGRPATYGAVIYGDDLSASAFRERITRIEKARMPVFGIAEEGKALLGIIESGDALAVVQAENAGRVNSYNSIRADFIVTPVGETYLASGQTKINTYQSRIYQGDIRVRYAFLTGEDAGYVGMAKEYRKYLVDTFGWERMEEAEGVPMYVEVIGAVEAVRPIMGIPRRVALPLTTFAQARAILDRLVSDGVDQIKMVYSGWLKGGIDHVYPTGSPLEKALGARSDLAALAAYAGEHGIEWYPEVGFLNVRRNTLFDRFNPYSHAARRLDRLMAQAYEFDPVTYAQKRESGKYVVSPSHLESLVDSFLRDYERLGLSGLALTYMADQVNSDFRQSSQRLVDRQQAREIQSSLLQRLSRERRLSLLVRGGFAYSLPYVRDVIQAPLESTRHRAVDESVPFYAIVAHGYVDYAGEPLNFAADRTHAVLKMVETGAAPYFRWFDADPSAVKETPYDHLFAASYTDWLDEATSLYHTLNERLRSVRSQRITDHRKLADGVYQTTYEHGVSVVVNYNDHAVDVMGESVAAKSFAVVER